MKTIALLLITVLFSMGCSKDGSSVSAVADMSGHYMKATCELVSGVYKYDVTVDSFVPSEGAYKVLNSKFESTDLVNFTDTTTISPNQSIDTMTVDSSGDFQVFDSLYNNGLCFAHANEILFFRVIKNGSTYDLSAFCTEAKTLLETLAGFVKIDNTETATITSKLKDVPCI